MNMQFWREESYDAYLERCREGQRLTLFQHIPKTAGSSLVREMWTNIGKMKRITIDYSHVPAIGDISQMMADAVDEFLRTFDPDLDMCASGHLMRADVDKIRKAMPDVRLVTFLRHPIQRVISDYRYQCTPLHPPHEEFIARFPTIEHYLDIDSEMNKMWRFMLGDLDDIEAGLADAEQTYTLVGIKELHPFSFNTMMQFHGKDVLPKVKIRVTETNAANKVELTDDLRNKIAARNRKDIALYRHFRNLLLIHRDGWRAARGMPSVGPA